MIGMALDFDLHTAQQRWSVAIENTGWILLLVLWVLLGFLL